MQTRRWWRSDPPTRSWCHLGVPSLPEIDWGFDNSDHAAPYGLYTTRSGAVVIASYSYRSEADPRWLTETGSEWTETPFYDVQDLDGYLAATSDLEDSPDADEFSLSV